MASASTAPSGYDGTVLTAQEKEAGGSGPRPHLMTSTDNSSSASGAAGVQTRISVTDPKIMVNLLGAKDEILRLIERTLVSDVHVRGNEITITGSPADNATAERLFAE